jgi:pyruvate/2-oxoglutarate dehydrogenase complex dihydrolipoamide acyltransferase (E2) component
MLKQEVRSRHTGRFDLQRKVVAHMTVDSWRNVPHVSYLYEPDITDFYEKFRALAQEERYLKQGLSLNTIMLRIIIEGLKSAPRLNALIEYHHRTGEGALQVCDDINISVPWLLSDGRMITPVICNSESMTLAELSEAVSELGQKIVRTDIDGLLEQAAAADTLKELKRGNLGVIPRILANLHRIGGIVGKGKRNDQNVPEDERLAVKDLTSGTVTVSNIGSLYREQKGCFGLLEIIPPQIFAIGLGAVTEKPGIYVDDDGHKAIGIRKTLPMCLVFDHRAADFNALVPFVKQLDGIFAKPDSADNW